MNILLPILGFLIISAVLSYILIDKVRHVVLLKRLLDDPNERSSHQVATPNLAGLGFFIVIMLGMYFLEAYDTHNILFCLIPGLTILFITGLKDDLLILAPISKLIAQIASACFLVFHPNFLISSLHGFMGIDVIPAWLAGVFAVLIIVTIINAVNLTDGIDGLAATLSIIMFIVFAVLFYLTEMHAMLLLSVLMIGTLVAFLPYNFSKSKKIFMGDTGSMILGYLLGALTVQFLALDDTYISKLPFKVQNLPFVVVAILIVPLFDTLRVFTVRILKGKSPFSADKSHVHHLLIERYKISHSWTTTIIGAINFLAIILFSILAISTDQVFLSIIFASFILALVVYFFMIHNPDKLRTARLRTKYTYYKFLKAAKKKKEKSSQTNKFNKNSTVEV